MIISHYLLLNKIILDKLFCIFLAINRSEGWLPISLLLQKPMLDQPAVLANDFNDPIQIITNEFAIIGGNRNKGEIWCLVHGISSCKCNDSFDGDKEWQRNQIPMPCQSHALHLDPVP